MKIPSPHIKEAVPLIVNAMASGQFMICPSQSVSESDIVAPIDDPNRMHNALMWNRKTFSFTLPDGSGIFCERLQGSDPMSQFGSDPVKYTEDWAEAEDETN